MDLQPIMGWSHRVTPIYANRRNRDATSMKVVVTGAAGFIGGHVAERFLKRGDIVVGIDNLSRPGNVDNLEFLRRAGRDHLCFQHADIRSAGDIDRIFAENADIEVVIHEAGQVAVTTSVLQPRMDFESNALGTLNVLEATRIRAPHAKFVYASTNKVYGGLEHRAIREAAQRYEYADNPEGVTEKEPVDFHSPYGCSKGAAEQYVRDYARIYALKTVAFRQSCIYGTRQYGMEDQGWVAWFTIAAMLNRPITVYGDGKQVRDLLWVEDLIDLYEHAIDRISVSAGQIYNAGGGASKTLSLLELLAMLESALGHPIRYAKKDWRSGDQRVFYANSGKARRDLGWQPKTSLEEGISSLIDWIRSHRTAIEVLLPPIPASVFN